MFGRDKRTKELVQENKELLARYNDLENKYVNMFAINDELRRTVDKLNEEKRVMLEQLKIFAPVIENPKLKPAVTPFCELCDYRVMSGSNVIGCCKDVVCSDFERKGNVRTISDLEYAKL